MYRCLYANEQDELLEHPHLLMLGRTGIDWALPEASEIIPLPQGSSLVSLPGRVPIGSNGNTPELCANDSWSENSGATAVAALLPQGFTRTLYPAYTTPPGAPPLPLLGYAAVGWHKDKVYVAAVQTDKHHSWHPRYYNTSGLPRRIERWLKKMPNNRILQQLAYCSLQYGCFTAQNIFYGRWEGGIPVSHACNAACIACISEEHPTMPSPQRRLPFTPEEAEIVELAGWHLRSARDPMISFGQGCEGEPALQAPLIAAAIRRIREITDRGTINMNTNAGYTAGVRLICDAGIDTLRISLFSAREKYYRYYHQPIDYGLDDVKRSMDYARQCGVKLALNLLLFPGFQDQAAETEALIELIREHDIATVQLRNLNIDPDRLFAGLPDHGHGAGIPYFLYQLQESLPELKIASYSSPK